MIVNGGVQRKCWDNTPLLPPEMMKMEPDLCRKCGICCHFIVKGKLVKCPYLKKDKDKTKCIRYYNRLGLIIGNKVKCTERKLSPYNYPDCPYNSLYPNKPMMPKVKE